MSKIKGTYEDIAERYLLKPKDTIDKLKNGEKVNSIPFEILRRIIEDDEYYNYAMKSFEHDFFFRMGVPHNKDISNIMVFEKKDILTSLAELLNSGRILATGMAKERFKNLRDSNTVSIDRLREIHTGEFETIIDGKEYTIPYKDIFDFMENSSSFDLKKYPDDYRNAFIMTAKDFIDNLIRNRRGTLARVKINPKLREAVFEGMPDDFTLPERAIFIYLRLCDLLTYSDDYYTLWFLDEISNEFESFDTINSITPESNDTVCFRTNMIYARLLGELGVGLNYDSIFKAEENYGFEHPELYFIIYDYLINADPLKSASNSDLMGVKLSSRINGLQCLNPESKEREEFGKIISKVYKVLQQIKMNKEESKHRFDTFKEGYRLLTSNIAPVSLDERLDILVYSINSTGLKGLDAIGSLLRLKNNIFNEEQNKSNVNMVIVRNLDTNNIRKKAMSNVVISINKEGFDKKPFETIYYLYNPGHSLEKIPREKLQIKCGIGTITCIDAEHKIPGIKYQEIKKERFI